jgi:hypothetical protein
MIFEENSRCLTRLRSVNLQEWRALRVLQGLTYLAGKHEKILQDGPDWAVWRVTHTTWGTGEKGEKSRGCLFHNKDTT